MKFTIATIAMAAISAISQAGDCTLDEAQNWLGPNQCWYDTECYGDRYCSAYGWCHGTANCPEVPTVAPIDQLQAEVDGLEQDIVDLTNDVTQMREAFILVTNILNNEFVN